ncbi:hypothetical protein K458DRAFT_383211 [Lentithecium fluviatile CBS 122367]|uniref:Sensor histidine kinase-like protein/response regulator n=1 Tax=Lentithecium fluviatile CBS 122367 TaxID=1168545 RepID=A0A6G1JIK9_9PLEO|nr:hypothetical protein K458DRAFT_383211 [Lentithecium fluviatile CBS 122367]
MVDSHVSSSTRPRAKIAPKPMDEADRTKEREFYRYYHQSQRPKGHVRGPQPSPTVELHKSLPSPPPEAASPAPHSSDDKALTAFAQLGALRLNTRRCLISFFDRRNCYILAEATKTLSINSGMAEFEEDSLCWGTAIFPKDKSICYYTVKLPFQHSIHPIDDYTAIPSLIVNDLSKDDRFKHYPFVVGEPHSRFYAGVPIRSPSGHSIGTYCVLDEKPRDGLTPFELNFLKDMATTVMRHLEMSRATDDHKRGGIMVKSLGSFADGRSNVDEWWEPWEAEAPMPNPEHVSAPRSRSSTLANTGSPGMTLPQPSPLSRDDSLDSSIPSVKGNSPTSPSTAPPESVSVTPASEVVENRKAEVTCKTSSSVASDGKDMISPELKEIFDRAAQMIVKATEAEGAVFFDAKVSTWGGLVDDDSFPEMPSEPDKPCVILGAARFSQSPSPLPYQCAMSEGLLKHLLRNYSHGQIFNLDDDSGTPVKHSDTFSDILGDELDVSASRRSESSRSSDDETPLKDCFPQARSLVLYPLWDTHRDRWFASVFIWSSDPLRVFTSEQELSFLAAFSNTAMAEVARLDTKLADAAKADFISSISHELRSPLHGILGMTDLLKSSHIDSQQSSQVETIETCGQTLLDTINHVLDYAKINNLTRGTSTKRSKKRSKKSKRSINPGQGQTNEVLTIISDIDISILVEDVLGSVFSGFHYSQALAQKLAQHSDKFDPPPVAIVVDINKSDNYVFRTQSGAWQRIIMNLFGNALKYTDAGFIKVKLQVQSKSDSGEDCELRLTVSDSGIGMSEDYVNNRLFTSFAQENPLSQGTGLGLSIVKQLVEHLGGTVEVRSERGRGTKFTVSCRMRPSTLSPPVGVLTPRQTLVDVKKRTNGMNVHFLGFEHEDDYFPVKIMKNKNATELTRKAFENQCIDWFGMRVWKHGAANAPAPDLFVATESGARCLRAEYSQDPEKAPTAPVIVICRGAASAQSTTAITVPGLIFECISQPCGPHKLAKALSSCLDRQANRHMAQSQSTETDTAINKMSSKVSQLDLKENTSPMSPRTMGRLQETSRPTIASTMSAPEIRSVVSTPVIPHIPAQRSLKCLAVDDNPINLRLLRTFVDKLGHTHVLAKTGLEALEAYKTSCTPAHTSATAVLPTLSPSALKDKPSSYIDVILMDINMPEMDGLEATRQIRAYERDMALPPVTIIALTGLASSETQQEAHASGVNLFLIKPVRLAELEVVLKGVVTGKEEDEKKEDYVAEGEETEAAQKQVGKEGGGLVVEVSKREVEAHSRSKSAIV